MFQSRVGQCFGVCVDFADEFKRTCAYYVDVCDRVTGLEEILTIKVTLLSYKHADLR